MATPNADKAPDPMVPSSSHDPRFSPDAGLEAWAEIPRAPDTIADLKLADPGCTVGSAEDEAAILDGAVREGHEEY